MHKECDSAPPSSKGDMELKLNKYTRDLNEAKKKVKRKEETLARLYNLNTLIHNRVQFHPHPLF